MSKGGAEQATQAVVQDLSSQLGGQIGMNSAQQQSLAQGLMDSFRRGENVNVGDLDRLRSGAPVLDLTSSYVPQQSDPLIDSVLGLLPELDDDVRGKLLYDLSQRYGGYIPKGFETGDREDEEAEGLLSSAPRHKPEVVDLTSRYLPEGQVKPGVVDLSARYMDNIPSNSKLGGLLDFL